MRNQRFLAGQVRLRIGRFGPGFIAFTANSRRTGFGLHPCSPLRHDHRVGGGKIRREGDRLQSHRASESHSPAHFKPKTLIRHSSDASFLGDGANRFRTEDNSSVPSRSSPPRRQPMARKIFLAPAVL